MGGDNLEAMAEVTLQGLGFKREVYPPTKELSGGWRMRIERQKYSLANPTYCCDEPHQPFDIESIQWLEEYLLTFGGSLILISHDRAFRQHNRAGHDLSLGKALRLQGTILQVRSVAPWSAVSSKWQPTKSAEDDCRHQGVYRTVSVQGHQGQSGAIA